MSKSFEDLLAQVAKCSKKIVSVACAQDKPVLEAVKAAGLPTITPVLICNTDAYPTFKTHAGKDVTNDDVVLELGK